MHKIIIFILILILLPFSRNSGYSQTDTSLTDTLKSEVDSNAVDTTIKKKKKYEGAQFLRIGTDVKAIAFPFMYPGKSFVEFSLDYKYRDKIYPTIEVGWGKGKYDYTHLNYSTKATYLRLGLDNSIITLRHKRDFDIAFVGFRYGMSFGNRSDATYSFESPFGGEFKGNYDSENFFIHWGEVTAGMKLEVYPRLFLGWTGRAKFLFNKNTFKNISPHYIAGYGSADKTTSFDASMYLQFLIFNMKKIKD